MKTRILQLGRSGLRWILIGGLTALSIAWIVQNNISTSTSRVNSLSSKSITPEWLAITIQAGDSLSSIFKKLEISTTVLDAVVSAKGEANPLQLIIPGEKVYFNFDQNHELQKIKYPLDADKILLVEKEAQGFVSKIIHIPLLDIKEFKSAVIHQSLAKTASNAGLDQNIIQQLNRLFATRINFQQAIQAGDSFSVLYDNYYANNKKVKTGDIIAAEFVHKGKSYHVIRYTNPKGQEGFYTPEGQSVEQSLARYPLSFKRISSPFSYHRMDPYIHRVHPHLGIDLATANGTPIHSIGDGMVQFVGSHGGYGNAVIIQYGSHYRALYGHMSHFAKNLHAHSAVKKGQVIGYVGSTGWATGPHLHFTIWKDGVVRNPLSIPLPGGPPIDRKYWPDFQEKTKGLLALLKLHQNPEFADNAQTDHE